MVVAVSHRRGARSWRMAIWSVRSTWNRPAPADWASTTGVSASTKGRALFARGCRAGGAAFCWARESPGPAL